MRYFIFLFVIIYSNLAFAQTSDSSSGIIQITEDQTTHLIFPSNITYVDLGNSTFFITDYTDNILRIKGQQHPATNLTIITQDQFYYSFLVKYSQNPQLNYFIEPQQSLKNLGNQANQQQMTYQSMPTNKPMTKPISKMVKSESLVSNNINNRNSNFKNDASNETSIQKISRTAQKILDEKPLPLFINDRHGDVKLKVTGVYHSLHHCYIKYEIQNSGAIPYDVSYTEFGIREKQRPKRTAINESILTPILILNGDRKRVLPYRINRYVAVFEKLAVPKNRICYMEVIEQGRNLHLNIPFQRIKIQAVKE